MDITEPLGLRTTRKDEKESTEKKLLKASNSLLSHTNILNIDKRKRRSFDAGTPKTSIQILEGKPGVFYTGANTP